MEMLQESLAEIQGQDIPSLDDTQVDLPVTAFVPADWITDPDEKIAACRAAADCLSAEALVELAAGWADRYGALPAAVVSLLQLMELKLLAKRVASPGSKPKSRTSFWRHRWKNPPSVCCGKGYLNTCTDDWSTSPGGIQHKVLARVLGCSYRQATGAIDEMVLMVAQLPDANGKTAADRRRNRLWE